MRDHMLGKFLALLRAAGMLLGMMGVTAWAADGPEDDAAQTETTEPGGGSEDPGTEPQPPEEQEDAAQVGETKYPTLQAAIDAAAPGDTVVLLRDVGVDAATGDITAAALTIDKDLTLDGGHGETGRYRLFAAQETQGVVVGPLINVVGGQVTLRNLELDGNGRARHGVNVFTPEDREEARTNVTMEWVQINNCSPGYGITIAGSDVSLANVVTGNDEWGGINVDNTPTSAAGGTLTITGSAIDTQIQEPASVVVENRKNEGTGPAVIIEGGFYQNVSPHSELTHDNWSIRISGGTFRAPVDPAYCAEGFVPVRKNFTDYTVEPAERLTISGEATMTVGEIQTLKVTPERITGLVWSSSREDRATVDEAGVVTAVAAGRVTITAAAGNAQGTFELTVNAATTGDNTGGGGGTGGGNTGGGGGSGGTGGGTGGGSGSGGTGGGGGALPPAPVEEIQEPETPLTGKPFLFTDVAEEDWFYSAVKYVFDQGMMEGTSETLFTPFGSTTRGTIVTILYRMEGEPEGAASQFPDVPEGQWYAKAVAWAQRSGIVEGYDDGQFHPDTLVTREQLATILRRYAQYKGYDVSAAAALDGFSDGGETGAWAEAGVKWAVAAGLLSGKENGSLDPTGTATRAETAAILQRFCQT